MPFSPPPPDWEREVIEHFISMFETFGLPKSTARIFGTLYCAEAPMMQEEISSRLGISAGSASQGLKLLQQLGAVHRAFPEGQRQSVYTAELSVRRLIGHFIEVQLRPKLENGKTSLHALSLQVPPENAHARHRVQTLINWQAKAAAALPLAARLFGTPS